MESHEAHNGQSRELIEELTGVQMTVAPSEISAVVDEKRSLTEGQRFRAGQVQVLFGLGDTVECMVL